MKACSNWPALGLLLSCLGTSKNKEVPQGKGRSPCWSKEPPPKTCKFLKGREEALVGGPKEPPQKTCKFLKGREEALVGGPKEPPQKTCKFLKG